MEANLSGAPSPQSDQQPADPQQAAPPARGLKIAVIVMGVILVVGFIAVFTTIAYRIANPRVPAESADAQAGFERSVPLPAGAEVTGLDFTGDRALMTVSGPGQARILIVLDTSRGRILGRFVLTAE